MDHSQTTFAQREVSMLRLLSLALVCAITLFLACFSPKVTLYAMADEEGRIAAPTKIYVVTGPDMEEAFWSDDADENALYAQLTNELAVQLKAQGYELVSERTNASIMAEISFYQSKPMISEYGVVEDYQGLWEGKVMSPIRWVRHSQKKVLSLSIWKADQWVQPLERAVLLLETLEELKPIPPEVNPLWFGFLDASSSSLDLANHIDEYVEILISNLGKSVDGQRFSIRPGRIGKK
ncbi:MAG TPA: hypothetical protein PLF13_05605 [candidate division Zixibacteria bacterium]|nr:hypothetical protein [candidate division Zixibacteria bacterium]